MKSGLLSQHRRFADLWGKLLCQWREVSNPFVPERFARMVSTARPVFIGGYMKYVGKFVTRINGRDASRSDMPIVPFSLVSASVHLRCYPMHYPVHFSFAG